MLSYYLRCREKTGSKNSRAVKTKNITVLPNWVVCGSKKKWDFLNDKKQKG